MIFDNKVMRGTVISEPLCYSCKHFFWGGCQAFPAGIPEPIITGQVAHTTSYDGDGGIQYEPVDLTAVK